ncbi:23S rRNA (adenine(1618)-N(6))-methyltransferase RlmF [Tenacibaculum agarivorans]|uniref:23S rRNA (adenine(1618)-N(6))-methyltransferase RlmF n=1 Tax=Tenacibaculum agarivorans TaxID=1908389 RepID=UPI00094B9910|nr:23S rRNA (adenine(1618)-N(6))-methyltransferase RlmF [Tenacibaculum agarivorans]
MHPRNIHKDSAYDFEQLVAVHPDLKAFVFVNNYNSKTIDFSNSDAVIALNKVLLKHYYKINDWQLPKGFLCPPIPSRVDYIHYVADVLPKEKKQIKGLDVGVGANAIYCILGAQVYNWEMVGCDINLESVEAAKINIGFTPKLQEKVSIVHQSNNAHIFEGIITPNDYFDFTMCNPPFHSSKEDAIKATSRKLKNLNDEEFKLNFGGKENELWCNGGESLFLKRMIKQSILVKEQVGIFTSLVSKKESLPKLEKQLKKLKASFKIIPMEHGNKKTRILIWSFSKNF